MHKFDNWDPGTRNMTAHCIGTKPGQGLPYWRAQIENQTISEVPMCYDPTYCETDPPEPPDKNLTMYRRPKKGSMKYEDGLTVLYTCSNIREYIVLGHFI